jgi:hypothetical protein
MVLRHPAPIEEIGADRQQMVYNDGRPGEERRLDGRRLNVMNCFFSRSPLQPYHAADAPDGDGSGVARRFASPTAAPP